MSHSVRLFATALVAFVVLDGLWLGVLMGRFYRTQLSPIARMSGGSMAPIWPAAVLVYLLLAGGISVFVVPLAQGVVWSAAIWGGMFGLALYGFYNLTNYAILARWPLAVVVVDISWGIVACALASAFVTVANNRFF